MPSSGTCKPYPWRTLSNHPFVSQWLLGPKRSKNNSLGQKSIKTTTIQIHFMIYLNNGFFPSLLSRIEYVQPVLPPLDHCGAQKRAK